MLDFIDDRRGFSRRSFLRVGSLALGGLALPQLLTAKTASSTSSKILRDKAVVFLFMHGGPSQIETFDPKMSAPVEIRSVTGEVQTKLPGVTFGGTFPKLAERADRLAIVRSFTFGGRSDHDLRPIAGRESLDANLGTVYSRIVGANRPGTGMPTNVVLFPRSVDPTAGPNNNVFGRLDSTGPFGSAYAPLVPGSSGGGGSLHEDMKLKVSRDRMEDRRQLLALFDGVKRKLDFEGFDDYQRQAYETILGGAEKAFDLSQENSRTVERYDTSRLVNPESVRLGPDGKQKGFYPRYVDHGKTLGKELLLARRLVEAGCGFVTVTTNFAWDHHADGNNPAMKEGMNFSGAVFDHAVSVFLDDLRDRGLDDKVLFVATGEMGRTPKLQSDGGRNHWPHSAPLLLAGGGLRMGQVIGQSTRDAGRPATEPMTVENLHATILHTLLDIGRLRLQTQFQEVIRIATAADPIPGLTL
ncbi:MAG: DUF1501 domain-containing protein [Planctomycetes bacterium]|nr:DUF1501 domain-containing protein [Planctomycetota bacterium]